jgi:hypothetical protein
LFATPAPQSSPFGVCDVYGFAVSDGVANIINVTGEWTFFVLQPYI